jgi:hypothetical protein
VKLDRGILAALGAAVLFGLSTPMAKTLVGEVGALGPYLLMYGLRMTDSASASLILNLERCHPYSQ